MKKGTKWHKGEPLGQFWSVGEVLQIHEKFLMEQISDVIKINLG